MSTGAGVIDRFRRPEYTGENRCIPCTAVNLVIGAALAVAAWLVVPVVFGLPAGAAAALGVALFLGAAGVIYLRGYLVPGTPWFTKTYFPDWLLRAFDKGPAAASTASARSTPDGESAGAFDVETVLQDAGAAEECADVDDLCLTPGFRDAWRAEIEAVRAADAHPGEQVAALGDGLSVEERDEVLFAREEGVVVGHWESKAAFVADVAAAEVLAERYRPWVELGVAERGAVLNGLRLFLERCPSCDGPVTFGEEVVESCCRFSDVVAVTCDDCGVRLFETEVVEDA